MFSEKKVISATRDSIFKRSRLCYVTKYSTWITTILSYSSLASQQAAKLQITGKQPWHIHDSINQPQPSTNHRPKTRLPHLSTSVPIPFYISPISFILGNGRTAWLKAYAAQVKQSSEDSVMDKASPHSGQFQVSLGMATQRILKNKLTNEEGRIVGT